MSRVFWMAVGAVGGIVAYRKGTQAATRARELGPIGSAQVAAQATSRLAGRTAHGLGRLNDLKARRDGRLVLGSAEELPTDPSGPAASAGGGHPGAADPAAATAPTAPVGTPVAAGAGTPVTTRQGA